MTNDKLLNPKPVIPSDLSAVALAKAEVEAATHRKKSARRGFPFRGETLRSIRRAPSTTLRFAQDDSDFGIRASSFIRHSPFVIRHYV